jgi:hypothetical protein
VGVLLKQDREIVVTEGVVKAAAGNKWSGPKVMELLLRYKKISVTGDAARVILKLFGKEWIKLLPNRSE